MSDLVQAYFERDLSPAEDEALAERLSQDPDAADRMAVLAEADYRALGLPYPPRSAPRFKLGWGSVLGLGLVAAGAWVFTRPEAPLPVEPVAQVESALPVAQPHAKPVLSAPIFSVRAVETGGFEVRLQPLPKGRVGAQVKGAGQVYVMEPAGPGLWRWSGSAPAGRYQVVLMAGEQSWKKWVEIQRH